jgi:hypothetical protein
VQGTRSSRGGTRDPGEPVGPLPANASVEEQIERLHKQLDGMHAVKKPLLGSYEVLSHSNRRQGGMLHTLRVSCCEDAESACYTRLKSRVEQ